MTGRSQLFLRQFLSRLSASVKRIQERRIDITPSNGVLRLLDLPEELLIHILSYLPLFTLISFRTISHTFNTLITQSTHLQYSIALKTHRIVDNPNCSIPVFERLRLLEAREEAWRLFEINSTKRKRIRVTYNASWLHDLNEGVFFLGDTQEPRDPDPSTITKRIKYYVLPSFRSPEVSHTTAWKNIDPGCEVLGVGTAIQEHDLIALVTTSTLGSETFPVIEIQLLQFSTRNLHPSATLPFLPVPCSNGRPYITLEILEHYLAILVVYNECIPDRLDHFVLFDWKTGDVIWVSELPFASFHTFTFLNSQTLLFTNLSGCLDIFHVPTIASTNLTGTLPRACSLALPRLRSSFHFIRMACHAEAKYVFPFYHDNRNHNRAESTYFLQYANKPFYPSPEDSIVHLSVIVKHRDNAAWGTDGMCRYTLFIHRRSLLGYVPPQSSAPTARTMAWNDWGPTCSRWIDGSYVFPSPVGRSVGERHIGYAIDRVIRVFDFNPHHVRLQLARDSTANAVALAGGVRKRGSNWTVRVVHGRTMFQDGPWRKKVYSELPYVLTSSEPIFRYYLVLMDEERVIGLETTEESGNRIKAIEVLHLG